MNYVFAGYALTFGVLALYAARIVLAEHRLRERPSEETPS